MGDSKKFTFDDVESVPNPNAPEQPYPTIPCQGCPAFEAVTYPSTPDHAEEYDSFCNAMDEDDSLGESIFLRFLEYQSDEGDVCPYRTLYELDTKYVALEAEAARLREASALFVQSMEDAADDYHAADMVLHAALDDSTIEAFCAVAKVAEGLDDICNLMEDWYCQSHSCDARGSITDPCILAPLRAVRRALYDALGKE